ncbi:MAG: Dickkopf N-terminal cysteine-rich domain-containing protein [Gammaproteobacteria bacterium]
MGRGFCFGGGFCLWRSGRSGRGLAGRVCRPISRRRRVCPRLSSCSRGWSRR